MARCAGGSSSTWTPPTTGSGSWPSATTASARGSGGRPVRAAGRGRRPGRAVDRTAARREGRRRAQPPRQHRDARVRGGGRALALGLLAAAIAGCGYSFRGNLPEHIQTVAVPVFANKTGEPRIESLLTNGVVEAFSTNGRLRVVKREDADAVLEGEGIGYSVQSISYDSQANVRQYRLTVTL